MRGGLPGAVRQPGDRRGGLPALLRRHLPGAGPPAASAGGAPAGLRALPARSGAPVGSVAQPRRSGARRRRRGLDRRRVALGAGGIAPGHAAGALVRQPDEGARQAPQAVRARRRPGRLPLRREHRRGSRRVPAGRPPLGDVRLRRDPPRPDEPARRLGLPLLGRPHPRGRLPAAPAQGTFHLADAKWTEHPDSRDAAGLRRIARELPDGAVRSMSIFCRAPNSYPLGAAADARVVPLDSPEALVDWT